MPDDHPCNSSLYGKLKEFWRSALLEYLCADALLTQIDNAEKQAALHIALCWQTLAGLSIAAQAESPSLCLIPLNFEELKAALHPEDLNVVPKQARPQWEEGARVIFAAARAYATEDSPPALNYTLVKNQLNFVGEVLHACRKRLDLRYAGWSMRCWRAHHRKLGAGALGICMLVYLFLAWLWQSANPRFWGKDEFHNFYVANAKQDWGALQYDKSLDKQPLRIAGKPFATGLGTHANSEIEISLGGRPRLFSGLCGVADECGSAGSIVCKIMAGGVELFHSPIRRGGEAAVPFSVPVAGLSSIALVVTDADDGKNCDHANWVDLTVEPSAAPR